MYGLMKMVKLLICRYYTEVFFSVGEFPLILIKSTKNCRNKMYQQVSNPDNIVRTSRAVLFHTDVTAMSLLI
jgi:hypothetical protein